MNTDPTLTAGLRVRAAIADALLAGVSADLDEAEVDGVLDCGFTATVAACRSTHRLVDFDEFVGVNAL